MGAGRSAKNRSGEELLREYNALFSDKTVQKVMRYFAVRDELEARFGKKAISGMAASLRARDQK